MSDTTLTVWSAIDNATTATGAAAPVTPPRSDLRAVTDNRPRVEELTIRVWLALRAMADPTHPAPAVTSGRLEHRLRAAIHRGPTGPETATTETTVDRALAAIRVACAYLAARDIPEARLALLAAESTLPRLRPSRTPSSAQLDAAHIAEQVRAVS